MACLHQTFTPVMDHAAWVQAVMKGETGRSRILEIPGAKAEAGASGPKVETKAEIKDEIKAETKG